MCNAPSIAHPLLVNMQSFPTPTKVEPAWGGNGGSAHDITEKPRRLESITIHSGFVIDSFAFSYITQDGETRAAGPWGGSSGHTETVSLSLVWSIHFVPPA